MINPEDHLSKEHWMNSFGTASIFWGLKGNKPVVGKSMMGESNLKRADIRSLPTKIPYEFMDNTVEHIFNGKIEKAGAPSEYATGWHYQEHFNPKGNKIIQILEQADEYGTIIADVEIKGIPKQDPSSFFSNKFTTNEVDDMINEAHMTKQKVFGTRNCYRGVAANGMTIEMFLAGDGTNINDIITAYPKHTSTLT
ncbi:EndoU domain-containing protein [Clostridium sp. C2-6-12]|uniref:EndoU domain-containing protein n=1 Tax=Clostridium sp. C2-6-12 TaxID=2698832 RepID=UPI00136875D8|nr:EndoU domain-containing protein [Clostridium sp. C2-6-12]